MLFKATGGKTHQWFWYFPHVLWADRITACKHPSGPLTTEELIGQRTRALVKHRDLVEEMRKKVDKEKRERVAKYEEDNAATIKDYHF